MKNLFINKDIIIPESELEFTTSRASGPDGQHVNKTDSRISVRWNIKKSIALSEEKKNQLLERLNNQITADGDLLIHASTSRSQAKNKEAALEKLIAKITEALRVTKKRIKTGIGENIKTKRATYKKRKKLIKTLRKKVILE